MTDDIVDWLRDLGDRAAFEPSAHHKAADEIETLRAALRGYACNCPSGFCLSVGTENNDVCGNAARAALEGEKTND